MKTLFIGEGPHEIGHRENVYPTQPQPARGILPALARQILPNLLKEVLALRWADIPRLNLREKKQGFEAKVIAAIVLSVRGLNCGATVCVADRDGDDARLPAMQRGRNRGLSLVGKIHVAVCGVAVESIEAWTLGAPTAIAAILGIEPQVVRDAIPLHRVETLSQRSGKPEHRPKDLLARIAGLTQKVDSTDWREEIAEKSDLAELERNCPKGFKAFSEALRAAFGASQQGAP